MSLRRLKKLVELILVAEVALLIHLIKSWDQTRQLLLLSFLLNLLSGSAWRVFWSEITPTAGSPCSSICPC